MVLWFVFGAIFGVWNVFQSPGLDFRLIAAGALLPELIDLPFGAQAYAHTLLAAVVVLVATMLLTTGRGRRLRRRRALGLAIGWFAALVLERVVGAQRGLLVARVRIGPARRAAARDLAGRRDRGAARRRGRVVGLDEVRSAGSATPRGVLPHRPPFYRGGAGMIAFVRHGQTELNRTGRLQGRLDVPLSALGEQQAAAVARGYASEPVTRVVSSPLQRAVATATAIADALGLPVEIDKRLVELDYGEWDGRALADIPADAWIAWRTEPAFAPPGGETLADVTARVSSFVAEVLADELVIAVSHVSPIKAAVCSALQVDDRVTWRMQLDVASVTRIGRRPDASPYLLGFNDSTLVRSVELP